MSDLIALLMNAAGGNEQHAAALATARIRELEADLARVTEERDRLRAHLHDEHQRHVSTMDERDALAAKLARCEAAAAMLDAVVQGAQEEFVRVPYGASHEDVAQINDWHAMAKEARAYFAERERNMK